jgi:hypothetical protein
MRRELSAPYTFLYRWIIPGALTVAAVAAIWSFARIGKPEAAQTTAVLTGVAIAFALMTLARWFDGAKRVWIDDDALVVAAYGKEIPIPLANVGRISQTGAVWPVRITIAFRDATAWGQKIVFFPPLRARGPVTPHPAVAELERAVRSARGPLDHPTA